MDRRSNWIYALILIIMLIAVAFAGCVSEDDGDEGNEPPTANIISASPDEGKAPLTVEFEGEGIDNDGTIVTYAWDFDDGDISTEQNPTHTFQEPGYYKVIFTVVDSGGAEAEDDVYINVIFAENFPPTATASVNESQVYVGQELAFIGLGTDPDGTIDLYEWDFDDDGTYDWGSVSTGNTTYTYDTAGFYDAIFRVTDNNQATDTDTVTITVDSPENRFPVAIIDEPEDGGSFTVGEPVEFDGSSSYDPEGENLTYVWNFGDGTSGHGETTTHSYDKAGGYKIKLTVNDGDLDAEATVSITIHELPPQNNPPVAEIIEPEDGASFEVSESVFFDGSGSYDPDGDSIAYGWDFGDDVTGTGETTTHSYTEDGTYTVTLTVNDGEYSDSDSIDIYIAPQGGTNQPPTAVITEPDNGDRHQINDTVAFDGTESSDPDGDMLNYTWDFDDGTLGYGVQTTHKYTENGTYTIVLTVNDSKLDDSDSRVIVIGDEVVVNTPPTAVISSPEMGQSFDVNEIVYCNGSDSFDLETDSEDLSYDWNFGDDSAHSTIANTTHQYTAEGMYIITLSVSDGELNDTASVLITITGATSENSAPTAQIVEPNNLATFAANENITFDGSDSSDPDNDPLTYKWYFGDGETATGVTATHSYAAPGVYLVTLEVSDGELNDTDVVTIFVTLGGRGTEGQDEAENGMESEQLGYFTEPVFGNFKFEAPYARKW